MRLLFEVEEGVVHAGFVVPEKNSYAIFGIGLLTVDMRNSCIFLPLDF